MADYYVDYNGNITRKKKKKKKKADYSVDINGNVTPIYNTSTESTNSSSKKDKKLDFFQKGAFEDGYQFGDVLKSIGGTIADTGLGMVQGVSSVGEGLADLVGYGVAQVSDWVGADDYADRIREEAKLNKTEQFFSKPNEYLDQYSFLGDTSDQITQALGQVALIVATGGAGASAGLGTLGTTALTTGLVGTSSMGSGMSEAYQGNATDGEAWAYGFSKGVIDAGTEMIFGGLGKTFKAIGFSKGLTSIDDVFARKVSEKISSQVAKNFVQFGVKASAEGLEEVLAGVGTSVAKKLTYMSEEDWWTLVKDENLLEQFVVATVTSGMMQSGYIPMTSHGSLNQANAQGRDFVTSYTQNEQAVIDKEFENRVKAEEKDGNKLSNKDKNKIYEEVQSDFEKGRISIDTIESAIGGETYKKYTDASSKIKELGKEFNALNKMKQGEMTGEQIDRRAELKQMISDMKNQPKELKAQLSKEVLELAKKDRLSNAYVEYSKRGQKLSIDTSKYKTESAKQTIKNLTESELINDSADAHDFADLMVNVSEDKGIVFRVMTTKQIRQSIKNGNPYGIEVDPKRVEGFVSGKNNEIIVNLDAKKSLTSLVGHEVTHTVEKANGYKDLQTALFKYAETKGELEARRKNIESRYEGYSKEDIDKELTADLLGDYLFTDKNFIQNLHAEKPSLFKRILNEIKYLCKMATAGSKEARELERVKKLFEEVYSESSKADAKTKLSVGYHAGDLGKAEVYGQQSSDRSTGHFGTGTYFVGDVEKIKGYNSRNGQDAPIEKVDFDNYNLYTVRNAKDGYRLHDALKVLDGGVNEAFLEKVFKGEFIAIDTTEEYRIAEEMFPDISERYKDANRIKAITTFADKYGIEYTSYEEFKETYDPWVYDAESLSKEEYDKRAEEDTKSTYYDTIKEEIYENAEKINKEYEKLRDAHFDFEILFGFRRDIDGALREVAQRKNPSHSADSNATVFMKALGYEGIDVRSVKELDNTMYGSVIYDLKGKDLARKQEIGTARYSLSDSEIKAKDNVYLKAVESGDMETAQKMVDEVAKKSGYTIRAYHGTNAEFNVFDPQMLGTKNFMADSAYKGFFAAKSKETAENYTGLNSADILSLHTNKDVQAEVEKIKAKHDFANAQAEYEEARRKFFDEYKEAHGYKEEVTDVVSKLSVMFPNNDSAIKDIRTSFEFDWNAKDSGNGQSNTVRMNAEFEETEESKKFKELNKQILAEWEQDEIVRRGYKPNIKNLYLKITNPLVYDFENEGRDIAFTDLIDEAKKEGIDGCIFKNVKDGGDFDDIYVVFENTQLKSADPITYDDNGNVIPLSERFKADNPDIRYSLSTEYEAYPKTKATMKPTESNLQKDNKTVRLVRNETMRKHNYTESDIKQVNDFMDKMASFMEKAGVTYRFIGLEDVNNAKVKIAYDKNGNPKRVTMSAMVRNGDYPVNFDFTSICKKRQSMSMVFKELANRKNNDGKSILDTINLDAKALWTINEELRKAGLETACLGCFVESKRYNVQNFSDKATKMWNTIVDEVRREQGKTDATEYFNFAEGVDIDSIDYNEIDRVFSAYNTEGGRSNPEGRMRALIKSGGEMYQKYLQPSDLMTPEGIEALKSMSTKKNNFYGIIQGVYGQAAPKEVMGFSPYNSEIALLPNTKTVNKKATDITKYIASIGGVRMQSFSDFVVSNVYDYMQMVADLSARHLPAHAYTKEIAFAKIFGLTGIKINLSVMFDIDSSLPSEYAGLQFVPDVNGTEEYNGVRGRFEYLVGDKKRSDSVYEATGNRPFVQSIGFDEAVELQNTEGYSKNIGIVGVGLSRNHILKMLDDNRIRYVIPYHSSSLPTVIKEVTNIKMATDYTDYQNTRTPSGEALAGLGGFDIYNDVKITQNPRQTAENYKRYCKENGYTPVFDEFASHDNYYKLIFDFDPYDTITGEYSPQTEVKNVYKGYDASQGLLSTTEIEKIIDDEMKTQNEANRQRNEKLPGVVDSVMEQLGIENDRVEFSLSDGNIAPIKEYGNFNIYGKDIKIQDVAPMKESARTEVVDEVAPTNAMPMKEDEEETNQGEKIAKILDEVPTVERAKDGFVAQAMEKVVDKGYVFEKLAKQTKNRELEGKWNSIRYAEGMAQNFIGKGNGDVKALRDIENEVAKEGLTKELQEYVYHMHNIDRMSLEQKASEKAEKLLAENPIIKKMMKMKHLSDIEDVLKKEFAQADIENLLNDEKLLAEIEKIASKDARKQTAKELKAKLKEYLELKAVKNKAVFGDSVTADVSRETVAQLEKAHPQFKGYAKELGKINDFLRNMLVEGGLISKETADLWAEMYPHFMPISRNGDYTLDINVPLDTRKTGVNAPIKRATGGNTDILPLFSTMAKRISQTYKAVAKNKFGVELKNTLNTVIASESTDVDNILDNIDQHEELLQKGKNGRKPTFTVFENGERVTFEIEDLMYEALQPTSKFLSQTHKIPNRLMSFHRGLLTEYNPSFMIRNPIKDSQDVLINSQHPAKTYANFGKAINEMRKNGKWFMEYMENGGEQNTYFDKSTNKFVEDAKGIKRVFGSISKANNFVERLPRLAEYIASREMGRSIEVSMLDAARVTTNFSAGGDVTKYLNRNGATFLNASVQGTMQQVRNIQEAKMNGLKGVIHLASKYAMAGIPFVLLNALRWEDDEEYEELSDYVKQNYYIVAKYGDGKFVRIPKGRMLAVIQDAFQQTSNALTGNDEVDLQSFLQLAVTNLAPNNPMEDNIIAPFVQVANNKTWYGDDLVPTRLQKLPTDEQYDETTDSISKWLGENFDPLGLGAYKINYLLDQYSGAIGDTFLPMLTPEAESGNDGFIGKMTAPIRDAFTTDSTLKNQNVSDFYDKSDELTTNASSMNATDEDILSNKYFNSISAEVSELYKQKREVQNSDLSDSEKYNLVREIQKEINALTSEALDNYDDVDIDGSYATVGGVHFRLTDSGWTKVTDKQYEKQSEVTDGLGISAGEYWNNKEEYDFAYENPGKYSIANTVGGFDAYKQFLSDLDDIRADKNASGESINGSAKRKKAAYINSLDLDYGQKIILYRSIYDSQADKNAYNRDIVEYLNSRDDISYEEMVTILEELGFKVHSDGTVTW